MSTFSTDVEVDLWSLEIDAFSPGSIMFSDKNSLKTTDGTTTTLLAGDANNIGYVNGNGATSRFYVIGTFVQLEPQKILIVDSSNHCLRTFDRASDTVSDYVGNCTNLGHVDGADGSVRFSFPWATLRDGNNIYISDYNNTLVRVLDLTDNSVTTLYATTSDKWLNSLLWENTDQSSRTILYVWENQIEKYSITTSTKETLLSAGTGSNDGDLYDTSFNFLFDMKTIYTDVYIASNTYSNQLLLLDFTNNASLTICTGTFGSTDGSVGACEIAYPSAIRLLGDTFYIGMGGNGGGIRTLPGIKVCYIILCSKSSVLLLKELLR